MVDSTPAMLARRALPRPVDRPRVAWSATQHRRYFIDVHRRCTECFVTLFGLDENYLLSKNAILRIIKFRDFISKPIKDGTLNS